MPVSHVGLTVARLPASCSFFASCLQPLGYQYIGELNGQVGFGVSEADFFLCQESFGQRSGANHIAFSAPSQSAVDDFFGVALRAGGRANHEPAFRDTVTGQYSASVIDLDNNVIEVTYRPGQDETATVIAGPSANRMIADGRSEVARTVVSTAPSKATTRQPLQSIVNAPASVALSVPASKVTEPEKKDSTFKAIGTLCLGAAAGVAFAYAINKADEQDKEAKRAREDAMVRDSPAREPSVVEPSVHSSKPPSAARRIEAPPSVAPSRFTTGPRSQTSPAHAIPQVESYVSTSTSRRSSRPLAMEETPRSMFAIEVAPATAPSLAVSRRSISPPRTAVSSRRRSSSQETQHSRRSKHTHRSVTAPLAPPSAANFPLPRSSGTSLVSVAKSTAPSTSPKSTASSSKTIKQADFPTPRSAVAMRSTTGTKLSRRSLNARDVPLPQSVASSGTVRAAEVPLPQSTASTNKSATRTVVPAHVALPASRPSTVVTAVRHKSGSKTGVDGGEVDLDDLGSVAPCDSVSQVSSKKSHHSHRSHKSHKSGSRHSHRD